MINAAVFNSRAEMLLTSGGITTDPMRERMHALAKLAGNLSKINVLRLADGWQPFDRQAQIGSSVRIKHAVESYGSKKWSAKYISWALGKQVSIFTVSLGELDPINVKGHLNSTDLLLVPGGNTYQVMRGLAKHKEIIREAVASGLPYVGESAGSIIAGSAIKPASLEPSDVCPDESLLSIPCLDLIDADVVVHARAIDRPFDIKGPSALIARLALSSIASDSLSYQPSNENGEVVILSEGNALSVEKGNPHWC